MTIKLDAVQAYLLNDIARRAMAYRRYVKDVERSCDMTIKGNLRSSIDFDSALRARTEWNGMEASFDALYESSGLDSAEAHRLRKIAITPTQDDGTYIRHWFKEGEEI